MTYLRYRDLVCVFDDGFQIAKDLLVRQERAVLRIETVEPVCTVNSCPSRCRRNGSQNCPRRITTTCLLSLFTCIRHPRYMSVWLYHYIPRYIDLYSSHR